MLIGWEKNTIMIKEKDIELMLSYKHEKEWFEFKSNFLNDDELGEYISALKIVLLIMEKNMLILFGGLMIKVMILLVLHLITIKMQNTTNH